VRACVRACARACVRVLVCVRARVRACAREGGRHEFGQVRCRQLPLAAWLPERENSILIARVHPNAVRVHACDLVVGRQRGIDHTTNSATSGLLKGFSRGTQGGTQGCWPPQSGIDRPTNQTCLCERCGAGPVFTPTLSWALATATDPPISFGKQVRLRSGDRFCGNRS
jgi:hypothetical protein